MTSIAANQFRENCTAFFRLYIEEGKFLYQKAKPSHLCVRSNDTQDFDTKVALAHEIGQVTLNKKDESTIAFVKLNAPIIHDGALAHCIDWLEITQPNDKKPMLVFAQENAETVLTDSKNGRCILRLQSKSAAQIIAQI